MANLQSEMPHAFRKLAALEAELQAEEERARQAAENAAEQARIKTEDAGDAAALDLLRELPSMYAARARKAAELVPLLRDFWAIESDIRRQEGEALQAVANSQRFSLPTREDRYARLRQAAHLPDRGDVGLQPPSDAGETLAQTVIQAITSRYLTPGAILLPGGRGMTFDFKG